MKAIAYDTYGSFEVLVLRDIARDYGTSFQEEMQRSGPLYATLTLPDLPDEDATAGHVGA
jgi:hypothetical protein